MKPIFKTFLIIATALFLIALSIHSLKNQSLYFEVRKIENDMVRITSVPDGNTWTTTKDSIQIYIDNY
ncbi:MAG: hypothetical protein KBC56_04835 [Flavobacterium sp.]|nr:hypothetical protein [Flavobacterium sp.]